MTEIGVTTAFDATPWARGALLRDPERTAMLADRVHAAGLRGRVRIGGRGDRGPWLVRIHAAGRQLEFPGRDLFGLLEFGLARWEAGADDAGHVWRADATGIAHAQPKGRATRTRCGIPALDERFRWPEVLRCRDCWQALDRVPVAA